MQILAFDPGLSGAVALLKDHSLLSVADMPTFEKEVNPSALDDWLAENVQGQVDAAFVERVSAMPGQGVASTFKFGQSYGTLLGLIAAKGYPLRRVTPSKWKGALGLSKDKGASRQLATERFPDFSEDFARVKDDGRAEAALIGLYGYQTLAAERGSKGLGPNVEPINNGWKTV